MIKICSKHYGFSPNGLDSLKSTRDQAEKVSEPYRQANMMAAEKTNPQNAESQDPGKTFLQEYLIGPDFSTLKSPGQPLLIPRRK